VTQGDRQGVPIGHGAFLGRRRLVIVKCVARLSGGLETSGDVSQGEFVAAAAYAVLAEEHMPDAHDLSTASSPYERSPNVIPLSSTAPTPHPLSSPPRREGHLPDTSWSP
jgi:hypothetical protein